MPSRKINILHPTLASKIAAGEVVDRPASAVKELMENSIDAGATAISVYITEGGKRLIRVVDNGEGISKDDAPLAFCRHATSKISKEEDLEHISTMGFRGEALASIAAVARVVLKTRRPGEIAGTCVTIDNNPPEVSEDGCPEGTSIEVKDLFYNTPARLKFLRSPESEFARIADIFKTLALANPSVRFRLVHGSSRPVEAPPGTLKDRIADLFGADVAKNIIEVKGPHITGYIGSHELSYPNSKALHTFVNGRAVRDKAINRAIIEAYGTIIDGRYPFAALDLKTPPEDVDVNIHPTKSEVRFKNPRFVYDTVKTAVRGALASGLPGTTGRAEGRVESSGPFAARTFQPSPYQRAAEKETGFAVKRTEPLVFDESLKDAKNPELNSLEPVGQLWGEFLVAQGGDFFYIIDQHGAAERVAFEKLKERYYGGGIRGQMLLIPERVETTPEERDYMTATLDSLGRLGFEVEDFGPSSFLGGQTFLIKSVPDILSSRGASALIKALSKDLSGSGAGAGESIDEALMRIACHSVIRGQRMLTREEARALLKDLANVDFAGHCPHGRPVVRRLSREEVEEMFKR